MREVNTYGQTTDLETESPTIQAENISFNNNTQLLSFDRGNGRGVIAVLSRTEIQFRPLDGLTYLNGQLLPNSEKIVAKGNIDELDLSSLGLQNGFYRVRLFEYNGFASNEKYIRDEATNNPLTFLSTVAPTLQSRSIQIDDFDETSVTFHWTKGNGTKRVVLMKEGSAVDSNPSNGTTYTASTTFGSGDEIGTGNYVVHNGNGDELTITGLTAGTTYHIRIFDYNGLAGSEIYLTATAANNPRQFDTQSEEPTSQVEDIVFENIASDELEISWTNGDGNKRLVVIKQGSSVDSLPIDKTTYNANEIFGSGSQLGSGNYVVYAGTGDTVTVSGLTPNVTYHVRIFEFNSTINGTENYLTDTATENPTSVKTFTSQFQAVIDYAISEEYDIPVLYSTGGQKGLVDIDALVTSRLANNSWNNQDVIWITLLGDSSLSDFATINYKNPDNFNLTLVNSPTYSTTGFKGTGTAYIDTGWIASSHAVNFKRNDASCICYITENAIGQALSAYGCSDTSSNIIVRLDPGQTNGSINYNVNTTVGTNVPSIANSSGLWHIYRTLFNSDFVFKNGSQLNNGISESVDMTNYVSVYILAMNQNGTASRVSSAWTVGLLEFGDDQVGKEATIDSIWDTYLAA